jgi:hypothetical protein
MLNFCAELNFHKKEVKSAGEKSQLLFSLVRRVSRKTSIKRAITVRDESN